MVATRVDTITAKLKTRSTPNTKQLPFCKKAQDKEEVGTFALIGELL